MNILKELLKWSRPEFRERHIFVVKLRLAVLGGFWFFYLTILWDVLDQTWFITGIMIFCFIVTSIATYNVLRGKWLLPSIVAEIISDLTAITGIIYMSGGPYSDFFTIYIFYILAAGLFFDHLVAAFLALGSTLWYGVFLWLCSHGVIRPLILKYGDQIPAQTHTPFHHYIFTIAFLLLAIYAVKISSSFSGRRERELEARNQEFTALHRMSSTIRSALRLREVIERLLLGLLEGLRFQAVAMIQLPRAEDEAIRLYVPRSHPRTREIENILGRTLDGLELPPQLLDMPLMRTIADRRIAYRKNLMEALEEYHDLPKRELCQRIQENLKVRRLIAVPIIAADALLGAFIGVTEDPFVDERSVRAFEAFSNQIALTLEAAMLIERLRQTNEELREANRVKSDFLATMSHELRTPLTAIIGFSELLLEGVMGELSQEQKESVHEVLQNGASLLSLINGLLDLAKLEAGKMALDVRDFQVPPLLHRVQRMIDSLVKRKQQKIHVRADGPFPICQGDELKLQQILLNLLSNAIKFTPKEGEIILAARPLSSGEIEFSVADTGIGIPADQLETIFEPFYQVDSSMTRSYGGTGLGLALAKQFIEMHGGKIWARSDAGKGATFIFQLPVK